MRTKTNPRFGDAASFRFVTEADVRGPAAQRVRFNVSPAEGERRRAKLLDWLAAQPNCQATLGAMTLWWA